MNKLSKRWLWKRKKYEEIFVSEAFSMLYIFYRTLYKSKILLSRTFNDITLDSITFHFNVIRNDDMNFKKRRKNLPVIAISSRVLRLGKCQSEKIMREEEEL